VTGITRGHWWCHHSLERTAYEFPFTFHRNYASIC